MPDIVGNLRIDQNWGFLGVSGAVHRVAGRYYSGNSELKGSSRRQIRLGGVGGRTLQSALARRATSSERISSTRKARSATRPKPAIGRCSTATASAWAGWPMESTTTSSTAELANSIELTNAWSVNAGYEHFWNPRWRTSLYGGYTRVWYDQTAKDIADEHLPTPATGALACGQPVEGAVWPPITLNHGEGNSCSPNFSFWQVGSRTQWNVSKDFYMGVDVTYTHLNTAYAGAAVSPFTTIYLGSSALDDQHVLSGIFRMQYNFAAGLEGPNVIFGR